MWSFLGCLLFLTASLGLLVWAGCSVLEPLFEYQPLTEKLWFLPGLAGALGAWFICRSAGLDAGSAILATSPGGLQAVVGMASDLGTNAPAVLAFHLVRLYTVLLLAPFLGWLLHRLLPHS